ncbi:hypothetical protein L484_020744 [Morus notabilis]|uniref:Uncharacterized protein n=1 Tax=Morus notabilis TaxID=981085 RepID=W9QLX4_9ROSA|nr:hypothetical protein L484_020744 [Morus notabilis]
MPLSLKSQSSPPQHDEAEPSPSQSQHFDVDYGFGIDNQSKDAPPNLKEHNTTTAHAAHAHEWNESIDNSPKTTANQNHGTRRPIPKRKTVSPPKINKNETRMRKKKKRWS